MKKMITQFILLSLLVGFVTFSITKIYDNEKLEELETSHRSELAYNHSEIISLKNEIDTKDKKIQNLVEKNSLLNDLNSSLLTLLQGDEDTGIKLPVGMTNTLRFMDYRTITDKTTLQYQFQQECETGVTTGIRIYTSPLGDAYYCAALAKGYGQTIGDGYHVTLENGEDFNIVLAECKGNDAGYFGHDDKNYDGQKCINIIEFVVDESKIPYEAKDKGTFTALDSFGGLYGNGGNIKSMEYLGRIWEPDGGTA